MKKDSNKKTSFKKQRLKYEEYFFRGVMLLSSCLIAFILGLIIYSILVKGVPSLSWEMITQTPKGGFYFGKEGGILNAIIGSIYLAFGATFIAFIIGLPISLYMNVWLSHKEKWVNMLRFILDLLWGIPSIVYGAFGFTIMILLGIKASLLAGIIVTALLILPIMIRAIDEGLKTVPKGLKESSYSLGSTKSELAFKIMLRQCIPGIVTAVLLSFGRAIGDAAAVLFTTGFTDNIPTALNQPTATLPLAIFFQLSSPIPEVKERAYAAAVILTSIILIISVLSRVLTQKYNKHTIKF
ncbi:MAG TPA: phosphate ABC transporter permease PstA [Prolixibacteraceae bacterium]|jgi:phosphate transport system permease protein|nr:phosphate ABC transporter permease PstA [Bacteroidales bacterium]HNZ71029.1 phosphate ABC transporter permease PstA [Prolixibacteraceae bacterium]